VIGALVARNLRHHGRLLLGAAAGLAAFEVLITYAAAQVEMSAGLRSFFELLPSGFRGAFAAQIDLISFNAAVAFGFQHPVALATGIAFVIVVATVPAAERETGFIDLLLARPLPRPAYLAATAVVVAATAVVLPAAVFLGAGVGLSLVSMPEELPWGRYAPCAVALSTLLLAIGGIVLFLSCGARRRGPAAAKAAGIVLACYIVDVLAELWRALGHVRWLSPFHYFHPVVAAVAPPMPATDPLILISIAAAATALAFARFRKLDL